MNYSLYKFIGIHYILDTEFEFNDKKILVVIFNDNDTEDDIKYFMSKLSERIIDVFIEFIKKLLIK